MGGSSKKQTVGYKYYLGKHIGLTLGPVDKLTRIDGDERRAWEGDSTGGRINVNAPKLYGGEKREGGIVGEIDFETGAPAQIRNDYLQARLGTAIPAFRGVAAVVLRQVYLGMNPYLKKLSFRLQRVHVRQDGVAQWYDAKSSINDGLTTPINETVWNYATEGFTNIVWQVAYGDGVFVAVCKDGRVEYSTDNGRTFTLASSGTIHEIRSVAYGNGYFVTAGSAPKVYSSNGVDWTPIVNDPWSQVINSASLAVRYGGGVWIMGGTNNIAYASNPAGPWTDVTTGGTSFTVYGLDYGNGVWMISGSARQVRKSIDNGLTWSILDFSFFGYSHNVVLRMRYVEWFGTHVWFALGQDGNLWRSIDAGDTWADVSPHASTVTDAWDIWVLPETGLLALASVSGGPDKPLQYSEDGGLTWAAWPGYSGPGLISLVRSDDTWVGTTTGAVLYSDQLVVLGSHEDMNPAHIIREALTDLDWGLSLAESRIDDTSFTAAADTLYTEKMGISILWDRQQPIEEFLHEITRHIDAAIFVDQQTGKIKLKLIRDDYDPNTLVELNEDNITRVTNYKRPSRDELINTVTVSFWDWQTGKTATITAHNDALILAQGGMNGTTIQYPGFTNHNIASLAALRDLKALSQRLLSCVIYANRAASNLTIASVFKFTWPDFEDGTPKTRIMRVTEIAFGNGMDNQVRIHCVEDVFATPVAAFIGEPGDAWVDPSQVPGPAQYRLVMEAPYMEMVQRLGQTSADQHLTLAPEAGWVMATAARPEHAINAVMSVDDGSGYEDSAAIDFCPFAFLDAEIGPTDTVWPIRDGEELDDVVIGSYAHVNGELVRVDVISETSMTVGRGILDTVPATTGRQSHADGSVILFADVYLDPDETEYALGEELDVKLLPFSGAGGVELADATADTVTMAQRAVRPYAPGNFKIDTVAYPVAPIALSATTSITWSHRDRLQQTSGEFADTLDADIGPEAGTTYTAQVYDHADALIDASTGVSGTSTTLDTSGASDAESLRFVLFSVRGGLESWQKHVWIVDQATYLWTPADTTTALWLDAADATTITLATSVVSQWDDKSGNARHATQGTPDSRPGYTSGVSVNFDGTDDFLAVASFNSITVSVLAVVKFGAARGGVLVAKRDDADYAYEVSAASDGRLFFGPNENANRASTAGGIINTTAIVGGVFDGTESRIHIDGSPDGAQAFAGSITSTATQFSIGRRMMTGANAGYFLGEFSEVLVIGTAVSTATRQRIEGYLAHKWGLAASLPVDHPYKTVPPMNHTFSVEGTSTAAWVSTT